jgi:DNA topoisomerase-3
MKLCIAEKPSVAKDLAAVLGANTRRDGYFEGNGYCVTWTFGHLCTLKEPEDYSPQWKSWSLNSLPILPPKFGIKLIKNSGVEKQFATIEKLVQQCEEVINCGDAGQEGELIQRWVLSKAKNTKPIKRLWISSLTEEAIKEGFQKLRPGKDFERLFAAGNSRAIGDWLLGMNATRLFTLKYGGYKQVLSIGRVQTPTLAMIVNRHLEIVNFKPETYWELATIYRGVTFNCTEGKFNEKEKAAGFLAEIKLSEFVVSSVQVKKANELPPRLFDLTSIQVECNKKFGLSADETLKTVQSLYEKKWVTYPRVDTTYLSDDIYPKIPGILKGMKGYDALVTPLLADKIRKSKKVFDNTKVTDHHAIIPTGVAPSGATYDELRVYDLIAKRFLAVFFPDCVVSNTTVLGNVKELEFKVTGRQILEAGWRIVYGVEEPDENDNEKQNEDNKQVLPQFIEGEKGPHEPTLSEKQTSPPKQFTEATLLRAMETAGKQVDDEELRELMKDNGIGRPSTRANIIETILRRNYIKKEKKNLVPTDTGIKLIQTIQSDLLKSAELTGQWERKLRMIEKGEYEVDTFKDELTAMVVNLIAEVNATVVTHKIFAITENKESISIVAGKSKPQNQPSSGEIKRKVKSEKPKTPFNPNEIVCPKCKSKGLISGKSALGCSNWKSGCDFKIPYEIGGKKMTGAIIEQLISKGKSGLQKDLNENGKVGQGYYKLLNGIIAIEWK